MPSCSSETRYFDPSAQRIIPGDFSSFICQNVVGVSYCPFLVNLGAPLKCCLDPDGFLCNNGTCGNNGPEACAPVAPSQAPVQSPPPASRLFTSAQTAPALTSLLGSAITSSTKTAPTPSSSSQQTCSGGLTCGNGQFCAADNQHCCPKQGQAFCSGSVTCFDPTADERCCGNTVCSAGLSCASGGNSCIGPSSTSMSTMFSSVKQESSRPASNTATPVVPTTSASDADEASIQSVLRTAVPQSVQNDRAGACFLETTYTAYTTPTWYTAMPSPAQSFFASVNAQNTAACVANINQGGGGLSTGAKAGIGVGVPVAAVALVGLVGFVLMKAGILGGAAGAASTSAWTGAAGGGGAAPSVPAMSAIAPGGAAGATTPGYASAIGAGAVGGAVAGASAPASSAVTGAGSGAHPTPAWNGVTGGEQGWNGVVGSGYPPSVPPGTHGVPPILAAGVVRRSISSERNRESYEPYPPQMGYGYSNTTSPTQYTPEYQYPPRSVQYPPRSVSPVAPYVGPEMYAYPSQQASEMSRIAAYNPRSELSTSGAYPGHEIYSNERFEAPAGDWDDRYGGHQHGAPYR